MVINLNSPIVYGITNIIDKFLLFIIPFFILKFYNDQINYNLIEYIYSFAVIFAVALDLGIKNFTLFFLKKSKKFRKDLFNVEKNFIFYFFIFSFINILIAIMIYIFFEKYYFIIFILLRITYLILLNFYKIFYRANDKPTKIFLVSILNSFLSLCLIITSKIFGYNLLICFFLAQFLFIFFFLIYKYYQKKFIFNNLNKKISFYKKSLSFSLPLILSILFFNFAMNFGKIYSFNYLSNSEMTVISTIQRILLVMTMFHAIFVGYFQKRIYLTKDHLIEKKILFNYLYLLLSISIFFLFFIEKISFILSGITTDKIVYFLLIFQTLIWCIASFMDNYLTKRNENFKILVYQFYSLVPYLFVIYILNINQLIVFKINFLITFSIALNIYSIIYLFLVLRRLKISECKLK